MSKTPSADGPTTEIVLRDGSGTLEVAAAFAQRFPALAPTEETLAIYEDNLGDEELSSRNFKRIKVPSGEIDTWQIVKAGKQIGEEKLKGVIIDIRKRRSYWEKEDPDGSFPDCSSSDGKVPDAGGFYAPDGVLASRNPQGMCRTCPMAKRGSDPKSDKGQACREQRLLFISPEGSFFPVIVTAPRTSVDSVVGYVMDLFEGQKRYSAVETELSLVKAKSSKGQTYNKIKLAIAGELTDEEAKAAQIYAAEIKAMIDQATADFADAGSVEAEGDGGISVGAPVS
jgi:hypothetical protein